MPRSIWTGNSNITIQGIAWSDFIYTKCTALNPPQPPRSPESGHANLNSILGSQRVVAIAFTLSLLAVFCFFSAQLEATAALRQLVVIIYTIFNPFSHPRPVSPAATRGQPYRPGGTSLYPSPQVPPKRKDKGKRTKERDKRKAHSRAALARLVTTDSLAPVLLGP